MNLLHLFLVTATLLVSLVKFTSPLKAQPATGAIVLPQPDWHPFCSAEGLFAIELPGTTKINAETFSTQITAHTYRRLYGLVVITPQPENAQKFLESFQVF